MAVSAKLFGNFAGSLGKKEQQLLNDTIKVMLCTNLYTPDQDAHDYKNDVTNEVAAGNGYTAGGATLGGKTLTYDGPSNTWKFDANDVVWSASTITARYAVLYDDTPATDATKPLIGYLDFGQDLSSSAGNFTITWATEGIFTIDTP